MICVSEAEEEVHILLPFVPSFFLSECREGRVGSTTKQLTQRRKRHTMKRNSAPTINHADQQCNAVVWVVILSIIGGILFSRGYSYHRTMHVVYIDNLCRSSHQRWCLRAQTVDEPKLTYQVETRVQYNSDQCRYNPRGNGCIRAMSRIPTDNHTVHTVYLYDNEDDVVYDEEWYRFFHLRFMIPGLVLMSCSGMCCAYCLCLYIFDGSCVDERPTTSSPSTRRYARIDEQNEDRRRRDEQQREDQRRREEQRREDQRRREEQRREHDEEKGNCEEEEREEKEREEEEEEEEGDAATEHEDEDDEGSSNTVWVDIDVDPRTNVGVRV